MVLELRQRDGYWEVKETFNANEDSVAFFHTKSEATKFMMQRVEQESKAAQKNIESRLVYFGGLVATVGQLLAAERN